MVVSTAFPNNVTDTLAESFGAIDLLSRLQVTGGPAEGIPAVFKRPLRQSDPKACIGVFPLDWAADEIEIGSTEPTLSTYAWAIQAFTKHTDEQVGAQTHALLSKAIRAMLYRDPGLRVALGQLSESSLGITERAQRWGVRQQRFANNEIDGQFVFLSTTDFWLQTESV